MVCHCVLVEGAEGLVLIDTGFGLEDTRNPRQLGLPFITAIRPRALAAETASAQIRELGFEAGDVRHIVATHLDLDHAGGLPDFPDAEVHLLGSDAEILLIPLPGHTLGLTGVAVKRGGNWLLHCGDAYFHHGEVETPAH